MPIAKVNGINFYFEVVGEGDPLVIINGLSMDVSESKILSDILAKRHRVLVFDNRGAGRTDKPDEPYTIEKLANDTVGVMKQAGFDKASILGISMGGRIALELVLVHPERVDKLILTSTSARTRKARGLRSFMLFAVMPRLPIFRGKYPQPFYAFERQRVASRSYSCADRLHEIDKPVLIVHGEGDKTTAPDLAEEMHAGIKGSQIKLFKGGHLFFLFREKQNYLKVVNDFLA